MDPFWKAIFGTLLSAASLVGASMSANWVANHTYRAHRAPPMLAELPRPVYTRVQHRYRVRHFTPRRIKMRTVHLPYRHRR